MSVTHPNVRGADRTGELVLLWSVIGLLVMGLGTVELALRLGDSADHVHQQLPANPFMLVLRLGQGHVRWPSAGTPIAAAIGGGALLVLVTVISRVLRRQAGGHRVDRAARHMGSGREIAGLSERGAGQIAKRLGLERPGLPIGRQIPSGRTLYASWEDAGIRSPASGRARRPRRRSTRCCTPRERCSPPPTSPI